jgi:hypothetical protein
MKSTSHLIGVLRDANCRDDQSSIFTLTLDVIKWAKSIKESYNSSSSLDIRFDDMNISTAASLSYAIWHAYSKIDESRTEVI